MKTIVLGFTVLLCTFINYLVFSDFTRGSLLQFNLRTAILSFILAVITMVVPFIFTGKRHPVSAKKIKSNMPG